MSERLNDVEDWATLALDRRARLMVRFRTAAVLSLILLCAAHDADAQSTGEIRGRVLDQTGAVLPGVAID